MSTKLKVYVYKFTKDFKIAYYYDLSATIIYVDSKWNSGHWQQNIPRYA